MAQKFLAISHFTVIPLQKDTPKPGGFDWLGYGLKMVYPRVLGKMSGQIARRMCVLGSDLAYLGSYRFVCSRKHADTD